MARTFENIGYFVEYMVNGKMIGTINLKEKDREVFGYYGTQENVAKTDIIFANRKRIKKGQVYKTRLYPLCGKVI